MRVQEALNIGTDPTYPDADPEHWIKLLRINFVNVHLTLGTYAYLWHRIYFLKLFLSSALHLSGVPVMCSIVEYRYRISGIHYYEINILLLPDYKSG
jgi:hypothetical protein